MHMLTEATYMRQVMMSHGLQVCSLCVGAFGSVIVLVLPQADAGGREQLDANRSAAYPC